MRPFRLKPVFKNYLWGGKKLTSSWGKNPDSLPLAESWELAAHKDGDNLILDGELKNLTLSEAVKKFPEIVASSFKSENIFPLMVKLLDTEQPLSVQVHPDNDYAMKNENSKGKTELWYILDSEPDAFLYVGFKEKITKLEFENSIKNNTLTNILKKIKVKKGDSFLIPAGTVHSIGAGITLAEIQENSNITYRIYDYGRVDIDGKPRKLHIKEALDVVDTCPPNLEAPGASEKFIADFEKFKIEKLKINGIHKFEKINGSFRFLLCIEGQAVINNEFEIPKGGNLFIPANFEEDFYIKGSGDFLIIQAGSRK